MCTQLFDPKVDYVFKNIFGSEKHPKILISFLNPCIKLEEPITSVIIKNTELTKEYIEESFSRLDVLATTQSGEVINIEMQRADERKCMNERRNFFLETLEKGLREGIEKGLEQGKYQEKIKTVISSHKLGLSFEQISQIVSLDIQQVKDILRIR